MGVRRALPLLSALALTACGAGQSGPRTIPEGPGPWGERQDIPRLHVPIGDRPARGGDRPLVELVVFSDFECSYCVANESVLRRLRNRHPDSLRIHHRHLPLPFHEHAEQAAQAAEAARAQGGDEAFWRFHDRLFRAPEDLSLDALVAHAEAIGLDGARLREAVEAQTHAPLVERDIELADRVGADGTPTMFLNGRPIHGTLPYPRLEQVLEEEIDLARQALADGVPREALYMVAMRSAEESVAPPPRPPPRRGPRQRLDQSVTYAVPVEGAPSLGPAEAPVTLVMFSDFQCPFCAAAMPTLAALLERYPDQLRIVFRHNPIPSHRDAFAAAEAASEAFAQGGDEAFWRMHDTLLSSPRALSRDDLLGYASEQGLDVDRFRAAIDEGSHEVAIERDQRLARRLGARVTPSFFVNGRVILGAQPLGIFVDRIEDALEDARARVEAGTAPSEVYAEVMAEGSAEAVWTSDDERPEQVELPVPEGAPRRGAAEPSVVIQVFSDFQCPFCRQVQPTLRRLLSEHPEVQLAFRHLPLPFHRDARPAAIAAVEVQRQLGDEAFWRYHDLLLEEADGLEPDSLLRFAERVGADPAEVRAAIDEERHGDVVDADLVALRNAGLRLGTPSFLVGNRLVVGAQPYEVFERAVREQSVPAAN